MDRVAFIARKSTPQIFFEVIERNPWSNLNPSLTQHQITRTAFESSQHPSFDFDEVDFDICTPEWKESETRCSLLVNSIAVHSSFVVVNSDRDLSMTRGEGGGGGGVLMLSTCFGHDTTDGGRGTGFGSWNRPHDCSTFSSSHLLLHDSNVIVNSSTENRRVITP